MNDFKHSTIYQIYPKSFQDSDGNGIGDIPGVISRIKYLADLGVDYIWLTPFFTSPQNDNGYDVSNYREIDPVYGTMQDFENLIEAANKYNIGIMLDMVFNHTSTSHEWFKQALKGNEKYKNYYIWKAPKKDGGPPTNWVSKFGGSAWEYVPQLEQYYLHLFDKTQADLNWENPEVRQEMQDVLDFWMDKGVKGFRFDVVNLIAKPELYEDDYEGDGRRFYTDGNKVHEYLKQLCAKANEKGMITVGEMSSTSIEKCIQYSNPAAKELTMCFNFHHLKVDYKNQNKWELQKPDITALKQLINEWQTGMQDGDGWNAVFWSNHDQPRVVSRFGNDKQYWEVSAKMLAATMYLTRGTPYIFQGEEIGMTNAYFDKISQYKDVESTNYFSILKKSGKPQEEILKILQERSRDNSRTPMQWDSSLNGGFTTGEPWLSANKNHVEINVSNQINEENSILSWYKALIQLRKNKNVVAKGRYIPIIAEHKAVLAYKREYEGEELLVISNLLEKEQVVDLDLKDNNGYRCILSNYQSRSLEEKVNLQPYEVRVYLKENK